MPNRKKAAQHKGHRWATGYVIALTYGAGLTASANLFSSPSQRFNSLGSLTGTSIIVYLVGLGTWAFIWHWGEGPIERTIAKTKARHVIMARQRTATLMVPVALLGMEIILNAALVYK